MSRMSRKKYLSQLPEKITAAYLVAMLGFYLLYHGFGGYMTITKQKWYCYLFLSGMYFLAILLYRLRLRATGGFNQSSFRNVVKTSTLSQKMVLGYWICSGISTLLSVDRGVAFWGGSRCEGFLAITLYCIGFLLISAYATSKKWMLWIFGLGMSLCCILALFQFAGYNPLRLYPEGMTYYDAYKNYSGEYLGTIGNVDVLSAVLCVAIPCFWIATVSLNGKRKYWILVPLLLCGFVLFKAFVAGGVVGVCGSALIAAPLLAKEKKQRRILMAAALTLTAMGLCAVYFLGGRIGGFIAEASALMHGQWNDRFGSGRLYIWREVLPLIPDRILFGGGPETLGLRLDAAFERYDPELDVIIRATVDVAHNEYLNVLVNQGILALGCYLAALVSGAVYWVKNAAHDPATAICGGAVLGYCIQAFFGISSPISAPFLWIAFALLSGKQFAEKKRKAE